MKDSLENIINSRLNFELINEIGIEGRNSRVFLAKDVQLNAEIILKIIKKNTFKSHAEYFKEAKIMYETQHPNICEINCASECDDYIYLSMPYYKKGSLNKKLEDKYLSVSEIIKYSLDFLTGVHYIHTKRLIHFDIKPTNILINNSNKAVLTDFGLSLHTNSNGIAVNTKFYNYHRPPEACSTTINLTIHSDIYQAGLTIYRMAVGNKIFNEQIAQFNSAPELYEAISKGVFPNRDKFPSYIPEKLQKIIKKSIDTDPNRRHQSIVELMNDLSKVEDGLNWEYNYNDNENKEILSLDSEGSTHVLEIAMNGEKYISNYKITNNITKKTRNKKDFSKEFKTFSELKRFLKGILK